MSAAEARTIVPHTFPDSRDTVENSAAPNASTSPTMANRKRTQTCESPIGNNPGEGESGALLGIMDCKVSEFKVSKTARCPRFAPSFGANLGTLDQHKPPQATM